MKSIFAKIKNGIKKNKLTFFIFKPLVDILRNCLKFMIRNRNLLNINNFSNKFKNIFIFDTRNHSIIFDSFVILIRGSNFFYNDKWTLIIYEDDLHRYSRQDITDDIYMNSLINIFLQSLLILPNPPIAIKFVHNSYELLKIISQSNKIFPEDYNYLSNNKQYLISDFNEKDFKNFKINQPILKAKKYHSEIFENYLKYRNIKKYITITIRDKNFGNEEWNTDLEDIKLYYKFIKENKLDNVDILLVPDTQKDIPREIINFIETNKLKYHIYFNASFSIPMRFLAYSKSSFNFGSTNGPLAMLWFIKNDAFFILKDSLQGEDNKNFVLKFNKEIFLDRKFYFNKRY